jgi:hypothetical protein
MKPIRDAVKEITRAVTQSVDFSKTIDALDLKGLAPVFDTKSWAAKFMPKLAMPILPRGLSRTMEPLTHRPPIESIDFDAIAAPLVSAREVEVTAEERANQLRSEQLQVRWSCSRKHAQMRRPAWKRCMSASPQQRVLRGRLG